MAPKKQTDDEMRAQILAGEVARLRESAAKSLAAAEEVGIEAKPLVPFPLDKTERAMLAGLTGLPDQLRKKLTGRGGKFTVTEIISMVTAVADRSLLLKQERQTSMEWAARKLLSGIHSDLLMPAWRAKARKKKPTRLLYQLKVTLIDSKPAIWRRIQVKDCTLDKLHEHIQTAMGWTNSHLHHFDIDGQLYGDPELMEENFHEMNYRDSTITLLSDVRARGRQAASVQVRDTTSAIRGSTRSCSRAVRSRRRARSTRCAWRANVPARRRTWAA